MEWFGLPPNQGLYDSSHEHDACGVAFVVDISVGGLGSIRGSFAAAAVLGISDIAGKYYVPQAGAFFIYLVMISLLMWRPAGLFGRR